MGFKEIAVFCELTLRQLSQIGELKVNFLFQKPSLLYKKKSLFFFFDRLTTFTTRFEKIPDREFYNFKHFLNLINILYFIGTQRL